MPDRARCLLILAALVIAAPSAFAAQPGQPSPFDTAWTEYADETNGKGLQFGCQPRRYQPPPGVERIGTVVAFHGFSACPQQYFQLGPLLATQGFDVLVPMLPGHGLKRLPDGQEQLDELPTSANWRKRYGGLAARMNDIAALAPGQRVIVGYSLGGTLALNAAFRAPELYDRMLLIAPLIRINVPAYLETVINVAGGTPVLRNWQPKPPSMEEDCDNWTASGRAGFCDYSLKYLPPLVKLERQNREWQRKTPLALPLFVILADNDVVVSNPAIREFVDLQSEHGSIELCELTGGVPHEILTPYENAGREMFWLPKFIQVASTFVTRGETSRCRAPNPPTP